MNTIRSLILLLALGTLSLTAADAPDLAQLKARMKANLPLIDKLKTAGKVGENNQAYLEARAELSETEKRLIETDNRDRKLIYTSLAERARTTLAEVQKVRAQQIRERSAKGLWLQDVPGQWYRKPDDPKEVERPE